MELTLEQLNTLSWNTVLFNPVSIFRVFLSYIFLQMAGISHFNSKYIFPHSTPVNFVLFCFGGRAKVDIDAPSSLHLFLFFFSVLLLWLFLAAYHLSLLWIRVWLTFQESISLASKRERFFSASKVCMRQKFELKRLNWHITWRVLINNGNRTEWSPIRSEIIRVINKIQ